MMMKNLARTTISAAILAAAVGGYLTLEQSHLAQAKAATLADATLPVSHSVAAGMTTVSDQLMTSINWCSDRG